MHMKIALVDTFYDTSHRSWAEGLVKHSEHVIDIYSASAHHWKWRMTGESVQMAWNLNKSKKTYDLIIATDMVNVPVFRSVIDKHFQNVPLLLYFHENQITYPINGPEKTSSLRDMHYGFINYVSALSAEKVVFNSYFHRSDFLQALPLFLSMFPAIRYSGSLAAIKQKSLVLPVGIESFHSSVHHQGNPVFLWNHRWEYDKNPDVFFQSLFEMKRRKIPFELIVTGKSFVNQPKIFDEAKRRLSSEIIHFGYAPKEKYIDLLSRANVSLVTSRQDFFGISFVEALAAGCLPVLPERLAFPEHIPDHLLNRVSYNHDEEIPDLLEKLIDERAYEDTSVFVNFVQKYLWENVIEDYDQLFHSFMDR